MHWNLLLALQMVCNLGALCLTLLTTWAFNANGFQNEIASECKSVCVNLYAWCCAVGWDLIQGSLPSRA